MEQTVKTPKETLRDLGDGLILRRSTAEDAGALAEFNGRIHSDAGPQEPEERVAAWTHDLLSRPHPTFQPEDFTIVEDTGAGRIVSSLNLISQTWSYGGIEFGVGRPELVGTLPEYRNRGLVRAQFETIHAWSAARGEILQAITGIPYYYRLFDYEMTINLGGGRAGFKMHIPRLAEGEVEPYRVRPVVEADLAFLAQVYAQGSRRSLVSCVWTDELWRYELSGKSEQHVNRSELRLIETQQGEPVGFLAHPPFLWGVMLAATAYELKPGLSWAEVTPTVIRYLESAGEALAAKAGAKVAFDSFGFWLGAQHPVYEVLHNRLARVRDPYAWYVRVADLPGFIRHIAPVLEARLAESPVVGHSCDLRLSFYRGGLRLVLEKGRLAVVEAWKPSPVGHTGSAGFPGLTFLQLLFGYRWLEELAYAFPDVFVNSDEAWAVLNALFPKRASDIWPIS